MSGAGSNPPQHTDLPQDPRLSPNLSLYSLSRSVIMPAISPDGHAEKNVREE